jgi:hypothetical protein
VRPAVPNRAVDVGTPRVAVGVSAHAGDLAQKDSESLADALGPASCQKWHRYAHAPAAALLTDLGTAVGRVGPEVVADADAPPAAIFSHSTPNGLHLAHARGRAAHIEARDLVAAPAIKTHRPILIRAILCRPKRV